MCIRMSKWTAKNYFTKLHVVKNTVPVITVPGRNQHLGIVILLHIVKWVKYIKFVCYKSQHFLDSIHLLWSSVFQSVFVVFSNNCENNYEIIILQYFWNAMSLWHVFIFRQILCVFVLFSLKKAWEKVTSLSKFELLIQHGEGNRKILGQG